MSDPTPVRMCVCGNVIFEELKASGVKSVDEAGDLFGCGVTCGTCLPYLKRMFETGETAFPVFWDDSKSVM